MRLYDVDIRKIIPAEILPDSLASGIARVSNLKNAKVVTAPTGKKVRWAVLCICRAGASTNFPLIIVHAKGCSVASWRNRCHSLLRPPQRHCVHGGPPDIGELGIFFLRVRVVSLTASSFTQTTAEAAITPSGEFEAKEVLRNALQTAVSKYIITNYPSEASAGSVYTKDESTFQVVVSGEKTSLKNFWSGRWASTWTVTVSGSSATIAGDIKVYS